MSGVGEALAAVVVAAGGFVTAVTLAALSFAKTLDERDRAEEEAERDAIESKEKVEEDRLSREKRIKEVEERRARGEVAVIEPFLDIPIGAECPKCGVVTTARGDREEWRGVACFPLVCKDAATCLAGDEPHLHVRCVTCKTRWMMRPKDAGRTEGSDAAKDRP